MTKSQQQATNNQQQRTLPEYNYSTRILEKNGFEWSGAVEDEEDGTVWEWRYKQ